MDALIIACVMLTLTTISFAVQAELRRRETRRMQALLDQASARSGKQRQLAYDDGLFEGWKRGWSESYSAACKADRLGLNPAEAVMRVGSLNAPALLAEREEIPV